MENLLQCLKREKEMMFALNEQDERIEASKKSIAKCPLCKSEVIAKCGEIKIWHWAHKNLEDCDVWTEPESLWHREWKNKVYSECCEVKIGNHRADIFFNNLVIELQNSLISPESIIERERYYKNMIWLFNAEEFAENISIRPKDNYVSFRWRYPRKSQWYITKPLFWDFDGNKILMVKKIYNSIPCGGWGFFMHKEKFIETYLR